MRSSRLKVFPGAAPGVGKTYRMLDEGRRRAARGTDVAVGFVECHRRPHTGEMLDGLEIVPRTEREYRGTVFSEMDLDALLARAWAAVSSLRSHDVEFSDEDRDELLATAEESLDRLNRLVDNLVDLNRLQAGALTLHRQPTALVDVPLPDSAVDIITQGLDGVPDVRADPSLLERVVANLVANAVRHTPAGKPVLISASALGSRVEPWIVDRGPGLPPEDRDRVFEPFQRLGDTDNTTRLGLGLVLSRGLTEAMGGTLSPEDTPGGGLTMVVPLSVA
jgi:two-component system sensor histidine kinase KdpD